MNNERITQQFVASAIVFESPCVITNLSFSDTSANAVGPSFMIYDSNDLTNLSNPVLECQALVLGGGTAVRDFVRDLDASYFPMKNGIVLVVTNGTASTSVMISWLPKWPRNFQMELTKGLFSQSAELREISNLLRAMKGDAK